MSGKGHERRVTYRTEAIIKAIEPIKREEQDKQRKLGYDRSFLEFALALRSKIGASRLGRFPTVAEVQQAIKDLVGDKPWYESDIKPHTNRCMEPAIVDGHVNMTSLLMAGVLLSDEAYEQKMDGLFKVFDENDDKRISREEATVFFTNLLSGARTMVDALLPEDKRPKVLPVFDLDHVPELVDRLFERTDSDKDGYVTIEDWEKWSNDKDALYGTLGTIGDVLKGGPGLLDED